jgi:hypothetical protein
MGCDMDRSRSGARALEEAWLKGDISRSIDCLAGADLLLRWWFFDFDWTNNQPKRYSGWRLHPNGWCNFEFGYGNREPEANRPVSSLGCYK